MRAQGHPGSSPADNVARVVRHRSRRRSPPRGFVSPPRAPLRHAAHSCVPSSFRPSTAASDRALLYAWPIASEGDEHRAVATATLTTIIATFFAIAVTAAVRLPPPLPSPPSSVRAVCSFTTASPAISTRRSPPSPPSSARAVWLYIVTARRLLRPTVCHPSLPPPPLPSPPNLHPSVATVAAVECARRVALHRHRPSPPRRRSSSLSSAAPKPPLPPLSSVAAPLPRYRPHRRSHHRRPHRRRSTTPPCSIWSAAARAPSAFRGEGPKEDGGPESSMPVDFLSTCMSPRVRPPGPVDTA